MNSTTTFILEFETIRADGNNELVEKLTLNLRNGFYYPQGKVNKYSLFNLISKPIIYRPTKLVQNGEIINLEYNQNFNG